MQEKSVRRKISLKRAFIITLLVFLAFPASAFAAQAESFWDLRWHWMNFVLYLVLLYFLVRKPIAQVWSSRISAIERDVTANKRNLEEANTRFEQVQSKLEQVDEEIRVFSEAIERESQKEAARVIDEAKAKAEKIIAQAKLSAIAEQKGLEAALRRELSEQVIEQAEARLKTGLSEAEHRALRDRAAGEVKSVIH
jgi:F-type H+-transporting ATPase subunit b